MSYATYVLDRLDRYAMQREWWWGWTLAWGVARSLAREESRQAHHRMVDRCVRVARHLREVNGEWPAEILVRNGSSVECIQVIDYPPMSLVFDQRAQPTTFRAVTIPVGVCRWGGDHQPPIDVWGYRATRDGEMVEFVAPK